MPQTGFFYTTPIWAIGCGLLVLLWLATEVGFHLGGRDARVLHVDRRASA